MNDNIKKEALDSIVGFLAPLNPDIFDISCSLFPDIRKSVNESIVREQEWLDRKPHWWQFKKRKIWLSENPNDKYYYTRKKV